MDEERGELQSVRDSLRGRDSYSFEFEKARGFLNLYMRGDVFLAYQSKNLSNFTASDLSASEFPVLQQQGLLYPVAQAPMQGTPLSYWESAMRNFVKVQRIWAPFFFSAQEIASHEEYAGRFSVSGNELSELVLNHFLNLTKAG